ncbi:MAG: PilZ domain-containing protein [Lachnospiraceae bacterium]|nr:PilZ domain-containing protein [Lachnospiraceae bacterium]
MDRRANLRIQKDFLGLLYIGADEYAVRILDVSEDGMAFSVDDPVNLDIYDRITVTVYEKYTTVCDDEKVFSGNVQAHIKNIIPLENGSVRYGCTVNDIKFFDYVQEQYVALSCKSR